MASKHSSQYDVWMRSPPSTSVADPSAYILRSRKVRYGKVLVHRPAVAKAHGLITANRSNVDTSRFVRDILLARRRQVQRRLVTRGQQAFEPAEASVMKFMMKHCLHFSIRAWRPCIQARLTSLPAKYEGLFLKGQCGVCPPASLQRSSGFSTCAHMRVVQKSVSAALNLPASRCL